MAKKNENLGGDKQLEEIIAAMKKHETVYKKMDYWKKKGLGPKGLLGQSMFISKAVGTSWT
jgi:hypothetical protein